MKIYFEDEELDCPDDFPNDNILIVINAKNGFTCCKRQLEIAKETEFRYSVIVYTNSLLALNNEYAWNDELGTPEIYLKNKDGDFTRLTS